MREGSHPYQALPIMVAYALMEPLKQGLDRLQKQQVIVPSDVDETSKWCNSFLLVLKTNVKVQLCLDLNRLNKVLIRLVHRGPTLNYILPRLAGIKCISLIDTSSGYHNLKLDEQSSYLTTFSCLFGRNSYIQLSFGVVPAGDMFQRKIVELFQ